MTATASKAPEQLRHTPHAMTAQGLMSGKDRFFDKQDQKRLDEDWLTGFDNRDRMAFLAEQIREVNEQLACQAGLGCCSGRCPSVGESATLLQRVEELQFEDIDLRCRESAGVAAFAGHSDAPDSDLAMIKVELDEAETLQSLWIKSWND
jgi:uncharacterized protein YPO0396